MTTTGCGSTTAEWHFEPPPAFEDNEAVAATPGRHPSGPAPTVPHHLTMSRPPPRRDPAGREPPNDDPTAPDRAGDDRVALRLTDGRAGAHVSGYPVSHRRSGSGRPRRVPSTDPTGRTDRHGGSRCREGSRSVALANREDRVGVVAVQEGTELGTGGAPVGRVRPPDTTSADRTRSRPGPGPSRVRRSSEWWGRRWPAALRADGPGGGAHPGRSRSGRRGGRGDIPDQVGPHGEGQVHGARPGPEHVSSRPPWPPWPPRHQWPPWPPWPPVAPWPPWPPWPGWRPGYPHLGRPESLGQARHVPDAVTVTAVPGRRSTAPGVRTVTSSVPPGRSSRTVATVASWPW